MSFSFLLAVHSLIRWLVLASLLYSIYRAYRGWFTGQAYGKWDTLVKNIAIVTMYIQIVLGLFLYLQSPIVEYFLQNFREAVHITDLRFFGMEHITSMILSAIMLSIGSWRARRRSRDKKRYRTLAIWFTLAFLLIFLSIPWSFSPFTSRPDFRAF